jgi:hypothetical protein
MRGIAVTSRNTPLLYKPNGYRKPSGKKRQQLASRQLLLKQHGAGSSCAVELKHILRQIDADHIKRLHGQTSWLWLRILQPWQQGAAGGASTPLYLYRAIDSNGDTVEFWFSERRNLTAAKRFLRKALKRHGRPERIVIDGSHPVV